MFNQQRQQQYPHSPPPQGSRRRVMVLPEPADVGQMVLRSSSNFAHRHKFITGSYIFGILMILLIGSGTKLNFDQRKQYNRIMNTIDLHAEFDASNQYWQAKEAYQATKGWFTCDGLCQRNKQRMESAKSHLDQIRKEGEARMSDAKSVAGIFSR